MIITFFEHVILAFGFFLCLFVGAVAKVKLYCRACGT